MPQIQTPEETSFPSYDFGLKQSSTPKLLIWSAADEGGIARLCKQFSTYFATISTDGTEHIQYMNNLAYTLNHRRGSLAWKSYAVADSLAEMQNLENLQSSPIRSAQNPKLTYIFTGQGAQWPKMGRELLIYPIFQKSLLDANNYLQKLGCGWSVLGEPSSTVHMDFTKPRKRKFCTKRIHPMSTIPG